MTTWREYVRPGAHGASFRPAVRSDEAAAGKRTSAGPSQPLSAGGRARAVQRPAGQMRGRWQSNAQAPVGPVVVEASSVDGNRVTVSPATFLALVQRTSPSVVVHTKQRLGRHRYHARSGDFTIETETNAELPFSQPQPLLARPEAPMPSIHGAQGAGGGWPRALQKSKHRGDHSHTLREYYTKDRYYVTEWWNTSDDAALSVARLRIEPGVTTRPYRLRGITERYLFLSGHGVVMVDGVAQEVAPGAGVLIKAGAARSVRNLGNRDLGLLAICRPRYRRLSHEVARGTV